MLASDLEESRQQEIRKMAEDHPAVKIAMENLKRAEEQLQATVILSKEHEQSTT